MIRHALKRLKCLFFFNRPRRRWGGGCRFRLPASPRTAFRSEGAVGARDFWWGRAIPLVLRVANTRLLDDANTHARSRQYAPLGSPIFPATTRTGHHPGDRAAPAGRPAEAPVRSAMARAPRAAVEKGPSVQRRCHDAGTVPGLAPAQPRYRRLATPSSNLAAPPTAPKSSTRQYSRAARTWQPYEMRAAFAANRRAGQRHGVPHSASQPRACRSPRRMRTAPSGVVPGPVLRLRPS